MLKLKTCMIAGTLAAGALALPGGLALAQSYPSSGMPAGPSAAPGGAGGSAPVTSVGSPTANAQDTMGGGTRSTTILSQSNKNQSAAGLPRSDYSSQAQLQYGGTQGAASGQMMMTEPADNPRAVAITDEYGNRYNSRGDRIGRGRPLR